ncbi:MAG: hypothetical protein KDJ75_08795 [Alphaproteobacteria bacterium]|nr:hypothetical protein [Alphaproteobacteria bacterium]
MSGEAAANTQTIQHDFKAQRAHYQRENPIYLIYCQRNADINKAKGHQGSGHAIAVADDGAEFAFTGVLYSQSLAKGFLGAHNDVKIMRVSEVREVVNKNGEPVNQDQWEGWRYSPSSQEKRISQDALPAEQVAIQISL